MSARPTIIVTEGSAPAPLAWLKERADVIETRADAPDFFEVLSRADGLLVRTYTRVDDAMLARAPKLKVIGRGGVGLENIDVAAARKRGIEVVYTPDANTLAVGDFVFGCMIRLLHPFAEFSAAIDPAEFKRRRDTLRGRQLNELSLGILGLGRVGKRVAHIASAGFGMRVIYNDIVSQSAAYTAVEKPTLYRESDVLSLHVDMRPGNEHLVARAELAMMKPTAILINSSRGEVLDANALADAIKSKRLAGAALDVFDPEPPSPDFPVLGLENVILTPHMAARTYTAIENMSWVVRDVIEVLEGRPPKYPAPVK